MTDERLNDAGSRYRLLKVALEQFSCEPAALNDEQAQQAQRIVARQLRIEQAVLHSEEAIGVILSEAQLENALHSIRSQYETPEAFALALENQGLDTEQLRAVLAVDLKVETVLERICAGLPEISDEVIQQYYNANLERFTRPAIRRTRHILITINPEYPENTREAARARIDGIRQRLQGKPHTFDQQAMKHSECPTAVEGGLLGDVTPGKLYPELDEYLFTMEARQLSPVLESPLGFHLLWCEAASPGGPTPLEEVQPRLREWLHSRQQQIHQREWLKALLQQHASLEKQAHG